MKVEGISTKSAAVILVLLLTAATSRAAIEYTVTELELEGTNTVPMSLNELGQVVGFYMPESGGRGACYWDVNGNFYALDGRTYPNDMACGINIHGTVAGIYDGQPCTWSDGAITHLSLLPDAIGGRGNDINDSGVAVGWQYTRISDQLYRAAVLYTADNRVIGLGSLGGDASFGYAISNAGHVVGPAYTETGDRHAFLWTESSGMVDLGALDGQTESRAWDVNSNGISVGGSGVQAVMWDENLNIISLGTVPGYSNCNAYAISDSSEVVGELYNFTGEESIFIWTPEEGMRDMQALIDPSCGLTLSYAYDINVLCVRHQ